MVLKLIFWLCCQKVLLLLNAKHPELLHDLKPEFTFIVSPVEKGYPSGKGIDVVSLDELTDRIGQMM
jgi:hypothetical protein